MSKKIVEIRPIEKKKWHGQKGINNFSNPVKMYAQRDSHSLTYKTGLDYTTKNFNHPKEKDVKITEAEYYGILLQQDLSPHFTKEVPHPFWDSNMATLKVSNATTLLYIDDNPLHYILYKIALGHDKIANSQAEYDEGLYPDATHIIFNEEENVEEKAKLIDLQEDATIRASKLTLEKKIQILIILTGVDYKGKSESFVKVAFSHEIAKNVESVLKYMKYDKTDLALEALVIKGLQKNILRKDGHKVKYFEYSLGAGTDGNFDEVVAYLKNPENDSLKLQLISKIDS